MGVDASKLIDRLGDARPVEMHGLVVSAVGLVLRATLPETWIGELCEVRNRRGSETLPAEVVGFRGDEALLMPLGEMRHVGTCSLVRRTGRSLSVAVGEGLLGRVVDGLGRPIDGRRVDEPLDHWPVDGAPPNPLSRPLVSRVFPTGVRVVDALLTVGEGQRVGIFAGAGVGKSTLLGMIARNSDADVVVVGLVGERGREVREFLERDLGPEGLARAVAVVATSDQPAMARLKAAYVATSIAEYFRSRGARTLLLVDSVTRFARARREVGLAAGEPPARGGFPPSVFAELPRLLERAGNDEAGSMTAIYTVLVEGDDPNEPIASEVRSILDGHVTLSGDRAGRGLFPAVDVARSVSRVMPSVVDAAHAEAARRIRTLLGAYERDRDLLLLGAYQPGSDPVVDEAAAKIGDLEALFAQRADEPAPFAETRARLVELAAPYTPEADLFEDYFGDFDAEEDAQS
jgi:FliI/YscN family ATPase